MTTSKAVHIYEHEGSVYIGLAGRVRGWKIATLSSDFYASAAEHAAAWATTDWSPGRGDGYVHAVLDGLTRVATWADGTLTVDGEPGELARYYLGVGATEVDRWNYRATFLAKTADDEQPMLSVAGVHVFSYIDEAEDGVPGLRINIRYDSAEDALSTEEDEVPTVVVAGGEVVWDSATPPPPCHRADEAGFRRAVPPVVDRRHIVEVAYFRPGCPGFYATAIATTDEGRGTYGVHTLIHNDDLGTWGLDTGRYDMTRERAREVARERGVERLEELSATGEVTL